MKIIKLFFQIFLCLLLSFNTTMAQYITDVKSIKKVADDFKTIFY